MSMLIEGLPLLSAKCAGKVVNSVNWSSDYQPIAYRL